MATKCYAISKVGYESRQKIIVFRIQVFHYVYIIIFDAPIKNDHSE